MIPKIIHQIWLGDKTKKPTKLMNTWRDMNPSWEYKIWTEETLPVLTNQTQFDSMKEYCGKADILRYEILYQFGGLYIDADSECILPLEDFFVDNDSFASYENETARGDLIANGYLGASKGNVLMMILIDQIKKVKNINHTAPWVVTGPALLTNTIKHFNYSDFVKYPSYYFIPKHYTGLEYKGTDKVFAKQYWGSTLGYESISDDSVVIEKKNGLNDVFDKIYCINLDKRTDRWEVASGQFERFNIDVERFSAIEHENGYMGCKLSHLNVIRDAQKNGYENIFIFEDDVLLNGEFNGNVSKVLDELKGFDWELFYLGGNVSLSTEKNKISNHLFRTNSVLTTHAYGINKSIFSKIISESENMAPISGYLRGDAIDVYYTHAVSKKLKSIITMPMLCTQLDGYSDIEKRDMSYNHIIK